MSHELRPAQVPIAEQVAEALKTVDSCLLRAETGFGKTALACHFAREKLAEGGRVLFLAERLELVRQAGERMEEWGLEPFKWHGANRVNFTGRERVVISTHQTVGRKQRLPEGWNPDLIIVDEAHVQHESVKRLIAERCFSGNAKAIGLSATPCSRRLDKTYHALVEAPPFRYMVREGILTDFKVKMCVPISTDGLKKVRRTWGMDYADSDIEARTSLVAGDIAKDWRRHTEKELAHADKVRTIAFCSTVDACEGLAKRMSDVGADFHVISYKQSDAEGMAQRRRSIQALQDGEIDGLVSVDAIARGYDCPPINCVILARPFNSWRIPLIQQLGRGARNAQTSRFAWCLTTAATSSRTGRR